MDAATVRIRALTGNRTDAEMRLFFLVTLPKKSVTGHKPGKPEKPA